MPSDSVEPIDGEYADGTWRVFMDAQGEVCGSAESNGQASSVCGSSDDLVLTLHDGDGTPVLLFGTAPDGTIGIATADARDSWSSWDETRAPDGGQIYVIVLEGEPIPTEVSFYGDDASELGTAEVDP